MTSLPDRASATHRAEQTGEGGTDFVDPAVDGCNPPADKEPAGAGQGY